MTHKTRIIISASCLLVSAAVASVLYFLQRQPEKKENAVAALLVGVEDIQSYAGPIALELTGLVVPFREINVVSEVTGRVIEKSELFRPGNYVAEGTILMRVDPTDYDLEITRLEADLAQSASAISELEVEISGAEELVRIATNDLALQESDFARRSSSNAGFSQAELDQAERAVLAAKTALSTQNNRLNLLRQSRNRLDSSQTIRRTDLELARIRRNRCVITAPADGVIVSESVALNGFVQPNAPIMTFEDTSRAEVRCNLRPDQLEWLWRHAPQAEAKPAEQIGPADAYRLPRLPVRVLHDRGAEQLEWQGVLDRFDGLGIDDQTKTIPTRVAVEQPITVGSRGQRALVRGMFVKLRVEIPTEPLRAFNQYFVEIPAKSLQPGNAVWVYRDNKLVSVPVQIVNTQEPSSPEGTRRLIVSLADGGLLLTDKVVTTPVGTYTDTMQVNVMVRSPASADGSTVESDRTRLTRQGTSPPASDLQTPESSDSPSPVDQPK